MEMVMAAMPYLTQTPQANTISNVPDWLGGTMAWWLLTIGVKAIGQRVRPDKVSEAVWDKILDALTLLFALQTALSMGQAPLVNSIVTVVKNLVDKVSGGAGLAGIITGLIIGIAFGILAVMQGLKFAKEDEKSSAWRPLVLFGLFSLIALQNVPWISTAVSWLTANATAPAANGIMAGIEFIFSRRIG